MYFSLRLHGQDARATVMRYGGMNSLAMILHERATVVEYGGMGILARDFVDVHLLTGGSQARIWSSLQRPGMSSPHFLHLPCSRRTALI